MSRPGSLRGYLESYLANGSMDDLANIDNLIREARANIITGLLSGRLEVAEKLRAIVMELIAQKEQLLKNDFELGVHSYCYKQRCSTTATTSPSEDNSRIREENVALHYQSFEVLFERRKDIPAMSFTVGSVLDANCGLPIVLDSKSLADADAMLSQCRSNMVAVREDEGLLNETLKGTVGRFVGILSKDDVARYLVWSQCDPKEAILIKAMRIPLREPMVSVTATMAEALEVMREYRLLYVEVSGPQGHLGVLDFASIKQQVAAWRRGNSGRKGFRISCSPPGNA